MSKLMRSLVLSAILSFATPVLMVSTLLSSLWLISCLPWVSAIGQVGSSQLVQFLTVFGDGSPLPGLLIIGATCALVGGVFDLFNFCLYQNSNVQS
ncbi:MAG: hypothetical protein ACRC6M_12520 [Microcystaceae cyanobacterium]